MSIKMYSKYFQNNCSFSLFQEIFLENYTGCGKIKEQLTEFALTP